MVVVLPSGFNQGACFGHVAKAVFVEALFAEFPVEAFDALSDELSEACRHGARLRGTARCRTERLHAALHAQNFFLDHRLKHLRIERQVGQRWRDVPARYLPRCFGFSSTLRLVRGAHDHDRGLCGDRGCRGPSRP